MTSEEEVFDSPQGWVARHIRQYVQTDGRRVRNGARGVPTQVLTTRGRKTGKLRRTALIYGVDSDGYLVASAISDRGLIAPEARLLTDLLKSSNGCP